MPKPKTIIAILIAVVLCLTVLVFVLLFSQCGNAAPDMIIEENISGDDLDVRPSEAEATPSVDNQITEYQTMIVGTWRYKNDSGSIAYIFEFRADKTLHVFSWDKKYDEYALDYMKEEIFDYRFEKSGDDYVLIVSAFGDETEPKLFEFTTDTQGRQILSLWQTGENGNKTYSTELVKQ